MVHASLPQLLARFPAAVPALLGDPQQQAAAQQGERQAATPPGAGQPAASGTAGTAAAGAAAPAGPVALVFGREESGLLESELLLCSHACSIPTGGTLTRCHAACPAWGDLPPALHGLLLLASSVWSSWAKPGQAALKLRHGVDMSLSAFLQGAASPA